MLSNRQRLVGWPLLIMDGGLTDAKPLDEIRLIVGVQQPQCDFWFYVEPVRRAYKTARVQQGRHRQHERVTMQMQTDFPDHFIEWTSIVSQANDGSPADAADLQQGIIPRSLRRDRVHLNDEGSRLLAGIIADKLEKSDLADACR